MEKEKQNTTDDDKTQHLGANFDVGRANLEECELKEFF